MSGSSTPASCTLVVEEESSSPPPETGTGAVTGTCRGASTGGAWRRA